MVSIDKPKQASQTNPQYRHYSDLILKIERTYPTKKWGFPRVRIAILIRVPNPKTRSTQKKMQEPEVPAFYFIFLGVPPPLATDEGQWPGGGCLTSFSFCTCPLYFTWVFLSYLMPSHFIGIFSLGPSILFYFFRGSTPPGNRRGYKRPILMSFGIALFSPTTTPSTTTSHTKTSAASNVSFQKPSSTTRTSELPPYESTVPYSTSSASPPPSPTRWYFENWSTAQTTSSRRPSPRSIVNLAKHTHGPLELDETYRMPTFSPNGRNSLRPGDPLSASSRHLSDLC